MFELLSDMFNIASIHRTASTSTQQASSMSVRWMLDVCLINAQKSRRQWLSQFYFFRD